MLIDTLRNDLLQARKDRNNISIKLLTTLVSESAMIGKNKGNRESTDEEVESTIRKFLKNAEETISHLNDDRREEIKEEITILEKYLPTQLSEKEIKTFFNSLPSGTNIGKAMQELKSKFPGQYNGKIASQIFNNKE